MKRIQHDPVSFEQEFERLSQLVERLESGNLPLEEMLGLYEEGMKLAGKLQEQLQKAELRVQKLAAIHEEGVPEAPPPPPGEFEEEDSLF